uniref:Globoside alpha-1,3-N-acetylgalactosaminyltransferase 1, like 4 n=1 Tax=Neogobius melanostomus TaxID=47308 RepID=A0A8C6UW54_9GOBI
MGYVLQYTEVFMDASLTGWGGVLGYLTANGVWLPSPRHINLLWRRCRSLCFCHGRQKYTRFLKGFLESGEKYFFVGFRVTYYIFTDNKHEVPNINLAPGRNISIQDIPSAKRWQDVVLSKMKWATVTIEKWLYKEADYLFMMDIDSIFHNRFGAETLSRLTTVLHRGYYKTNRDSFPYERDPKSQAYIPHGEGDYYYTAAVWGGYMEDMYKLKSQEDVKNGVEAAWQEENYDTVPKDIRVIRISQLIKNYAEVRPNGGQ